MRIFLYSLILVFSFTFSGDQVFAQQQPNQNTNQVLPKIMVIPFTKDGQDIRTVLEADFNKRLAVTKVKNGFDTRGFTTKDFSATLKQAKDDQDLHNQHPNGCKKHAGTIFRRRYLCRGGCAPGYGCQCIGTGTSYRL